MSANHLYRSSAAIIHFERRRSPSVTACRCDWKHRRIRWRRRIHCCEAQPTNARNAFICNLATMLSDPILTRAKPRYVAILATTYTANSSASCKEPIKGGQHIDLENPFSPTIPNRYPQHQQIPPRPRHRTVPEGQPLEGRKRRAKLLQPLWPPPSKPALPLPHSSISTCQKGPQACIGPAKPAELT